ncbi:MAG: amidohydrolase [Ignavibacteriae bacterium]|nr:MAG: amidohydrolase [Ignavibacteriota bacterium]
MKAIKILFLLSFCIFLASCSKKPDVIYINGKIYTLDKDNTIAEAVAVSEGKILAVGKSKELTDKYSSSRIVDLNGKTVVPGFIDAEGNLMEFSRNLSFIDLRSARNLDDIIRIVSDKVKTSPAGEWVGGFGWDELLLPDADFQKIDHTVLDKISAVHHIYLINARANITWVNKMILDEAKINKSTPDPENGEIEKDEKSEPTGLLYDDAQELVIKILPQPSQAQVISNVQKGITELVKYGITEVNDANMSEEVLETYKKMVDDNKFSIRLYAMIPGKGPLFDKYVASGPETYKDRIDIKCFHLEYDGYFETQDAAMENDYLKEPKRKTPYNDEYDIKEMTAKAFEKGFQVSVKANGDRAVKSSLNAIETVSKDVKSKVGRTRFEYVEFIQPNDLQRLKQLEIIPSVRPEVAMENKMAVNELINPNDSKNLGLWNTLFKLNNIIMAGTDFPYHYINPLYQMYFLSTGLSLDTAANRISNNTAQKLSVIDALKAFTVWAAYGSLADEFKGTLEPGKLADMVVLSDNILESDPQVLLKTRILMTIIRGEVVYENKTPAAYIY